MGKLLSIMPKGKKEDEVISSAVPNRFDRISSIIHSGIEDINVLANTYNSINIAIGNRASIKADNMVKVTAVELNMKQEENRHIEEMEKLEQEWLKISKSAENRDEYIKIIKKQVEYFQLEYDKYLQYDDDIFLSEEVTRRLADLRGKIVELTKELV